MARLVQPVEGELKLNGLRINYFEWKGRGRRPLVLMHGLRDYSYYWQDCANRLLDDFHVYTFDQRGHGESERAPGGYLVWALAADLAAFVDAVGLERFDIAGLSLGSRCSMAYARDNWQRLGHWRPKNARASPWAKELGGTSAFAVMSALRPRAPTLAICGPMSISTRWPSRCQLSRA